MTEEVNLFEEDENQEPEVDVQRYRRGEGVFINFRFRNRKDLIEFANKIDLPYLKSMKYKSIVKVEWSSKKEERDPLSQFFEDI